MTAHGADLGNPVALAMADCIASRRAWEAGGFPLPSRQGKADPALSPVIRVSPSRHWPIQAIAGSDQTTTGLSPLLVNGLIHADEEVWQGIGNSRSHRIVRLLTPPCFDARTKRIFAPRDRLLTLADELHQHSLIPSLAIGWR